MIILKRILNMKPFAFAALFFLLCLFLFHGGGTAGCGGAAAPIDLEAPTADLEGACDVIANVCDTIDGAPEGARVRITNTTTGEATDGPIAADDSFSLRVNIEVGEAITVQIFDKDGEAISDTQTITRDVFGETDLCPDPTNVSLEFHALDSSRAQKVCP